MNKCQNCQKETKNKFYCSNKCVGQSMGLNRRKDNLFNLTCQKCGKEFTHTLSYDIKVGRMKYCSTECRARKYLVNDSYFASPLTSDKLITLGQIIACGHLRNYRTLKIFSTLSVLEDIASKLGSTYPIEKSDKGLYSLIINSTQMVSDLVELGLGEEHLKMEVPGFDGDILWEGLKSTHCYTEVDGLCKYRSERSKVVLWVFNRFGGVTYTESFKDKFRGCFGSYNIVVWENG